MDKKQKYTILHADGYNAVYFGKTNIRNSSRAQKFRKVNWRCAMIYHKYIDIFKEYGIDVDKCIIIEGCYDTNIHTLERTMNPENIGEFSKHPDKVNMKKLEAAVKVTLRKLSMYEINEIPDFDYVYGTLIGVNKKPGYRYEECHCLQTKAASLPFAIEVAKMRWEYVSETESDKLNHIDMRPGVYTIGARNKRDYDYEDGELAVSRAVHMPELHVELTSAPWVDLLTEKIKDVSSGPIYIGNSILEWQRLYNDLDGSSYVLEGDYKRFDSTLYIRIITAALAVMRCLFPIDNLYVDKHFIAMYDSIAIKDYYVVGGKVFRLYHGLPSGVKSTSILGSIINLITLIYNIGPNIAKFFRFIVGGDDFLVACFNSNVAPIERTIRKFEIRCKKLGMKTKFLLPKYFLSDQIDDCPVFYKYTIYDNKPMVPVNAFLERVFMPWNRAYRSDFELIDFLYAVMPSLGSPGSHLLLYYAFLSRILKLVTKVSITYAELYKMHDRLFEKMMLRKEVSRLSFKEDNETDKLCCVVLIKTNKEYQSSEIKEKFKFDYSLF